MKTQISVKGQQVWVPELRIDETSVVVTGGMIRKAAVRDEEYAEHDAALNAERLVAEIGKQNTGADLFCFQHRLPDRTPRYSYPMRWDNVAAIPITSYDEWMKGLSPDTRRNVRLGGKRGVIVREASYDDEFIRGIQSIYSETSVRHGRPFWHFGKPFETVKSENGTYLDRSTFIGAYYEGELVGFIKMVTVGSYASIMQILGKTAHQDKRCTNAMIGKAVELCSERGLSHLVYCKYTYHHGYEDQLTEFKRRNGFRPILLPRYYVPFTAKGRLAIALNIQSGIHDVLPRRVLATMLRFRSRY